jgi:hypothetical protein
MRDSTLTRISISNHKKLKEAASETNISMRAYHEMILDLWFKNKFNESMSTIEYFVAKYGNPQQSLC